VEADSLREIPVLDRVELGTVSRIFGREELETVLEEFRHHLVVLKCKAKYCRPCKVFAKKYLRFAEEFSDVLFLEIVGDENKQTRLMMMEFEVKATPTFRYYLDGECVTITVGIKEEKVRDAILFFRPPNALPHSS